MKKFLERSVLVLILTGMAPVLASADDILAQFDGGIGVIPVSSVTTATPPVINRNVVRGVNPPGQIWTIEDLKATVKIDGTISVDGRGLLLAGGDAIGTTAGLSVFATLICGAKAPFTLSSTNLAGVPLAANGDFRIDDALAPAPANPCASPVLLIRNTANQGWFAAGIPKGADGQE